MRNLVFGVDFGVDSEEYRGINDYSLESPIYPISPICNTSSAQPGLAFMQIDPHFLPPILLHPSRTWR